MKNFHVQMVNIVDGNVLTVQLAGTQINFLNTVVLVVQKVLFNKILVARIVLVVQWENTHVKLQVRNVKMLKLIWIYLIILKVYDFLLIRLHI